VTTSEIVAYVLIDIVLIVALARFVGSLMKHIGQPAVVGEIIAGIILGPTVIGASLAADVFPVEARPSLAAIATLALIFFMFLVGLDLDLELLKGRYLQAGVVTVAAVAVPFAGGMLVAPLLHDQKYFAGELPDSTSFALFIGAAMTVTAFPVMARILVERRLSRTTMGAVGLASAACVTVALFILLGVAAGSASGQGPSSSLLKVGWTVLFLVVMFGPVRYLLRWLGRYYDRVGRLTPNVIATLFVLITLSGYVTDRIGINAVIGPFVLGLCLPRRAGMARELTDRIESFAVLFLLPVFFGFSGLATDLRVLTPELLVGAVALIAVGIATKWFASAAAGRLVGLTWREGNLLGVLMSCRGLLPLIVAQVGASVGVIEAGGAVYAILVVYALVTTLMTNPAASLFLPKEPAEGPDVQIDAAAAASHRVLVAVGPGGSAARLAGAAKALAGDLRPLELVVASPAELPESQIRSGLVDAERDVQATLSGLVPLGAVVGGPGVTVTPVAYQSPDVVDDFLRLVERLRPELVVTGIRSRHRAADAARAAALAAGGDVRTVVFYDPTGEGVHAGMEGGIVAEASVADVGGALSEGLGLPLADGAPAGAAALVVPMSEGWEDLLTSTSVPLFLVAEPVASPIGVSAPG